MNKNTQLGLIAILISTIAFNTLYKETTNDIPREVVIAFNEWKQTQTRLYSTPSEQTHRLNVFYKNYKLVNEINSQNLSYTFALNDFADLTKEEFAAKYLSKAAPAKEFKLEGALEAPKEHLKQQPVDNWDWSKNGCNTGIYKQGNCAAGYAIAAANAVTYAWFCNNKGQSIQTSAQELVDCSANFGNTGCSGGYTTNSFKYIYSNGLSYESSYPYTGYQSGFCKGSTPSQYRISNYYQVDRNNNDKLKQAVRQQPITAAVDASTWQFYSGGAFDGNGCSTSSITHFVTVVGYGTISSRPVWKVENSWGNTWGEQGYLYIVRSSGYSSYPCGLPTNTFYPFFQ